MLKQKAGPPSHSLIPEIWGGPKIGMQMLLVQKPDFGNHCSGEALQKAEGRAFCSWSFMNRLGFHRRERTDNDGVACCQALGRAPSTGSATLPGGYF